MNSCLEEGAEDFIVKPVKLSDVRRLKNYMKIDDRARGNEDRGINKRKLRDEFTRDLTESSASFISPSSQSEFSSSSISSPSSPTWLDSPTRRLRMTNL